MDHNTAFLRAIELAGTTGEPHAVIYDGTEFDAKQVEEAGSELRSQIVVTPGGAWYFADRNLGEKEPEKPRTPEPVTDEEEDEDADT